MSDVMSRQDLECRGNPCGFPPTGGDKPLLLHIRYLFIAPLAICQLSP